VTTTADRFLAFADQASGESAVYEEAARGIAGDSDVLELLDALPEQKRQPPLVLACARYLGAPLGPWPSLRSWLLAERETLAAAMLRRHTQINEPRRCAVLLPALALLPGPLAVVEVGASAGLTLLPDRYAYRYVDTSGGERRVGDGAPVLECATEGPVPVPDAVPDIRWRCGLDLAPLDVGDPEDVRWLEALVWPGQHERLQRTRAAAAVARAHRARIEEGDAVDDLERLVADVPSGMTVVVVSLGTLVYLPGARRQLFRDLVQRLGCRSITLERLGVLPDLVPDRRPPAVLAAPCLLTLDGAPLAFASPHGELLAWL
jgi:hypothetical protein